jgi:hypothetical protein
MSKFANMLSNARNKKLTIIIVTLGFGVMLAPRDPAIFSTPAGAQILPAMISGIGFGMAIILLIDVVRGFGDKSNKETNT